jgi:23S rRNA (uracil1939-C5)-methyltransferase
MEITENVAADERAHHLELREEADAVRVAGVSERLGTRRSVTEVIDIRPGAALLTLTRDVRSFFQGNRFLLERLVRHVVDLVPPGPVVDLYAGVGLFGLSLTAAGADEVTLVEGDPTSGADLQRNAAPFGGAARVERRSVEAYLADRSRHAGAGSHPAGATTVIVDPPRTGMSKEALAGVIQVRPKRIVYVSCDVATFARDTRTLLDAGYELGEVTGIDLFPNTAHVEAVSWFIDEG